MRRGFIAAVALGMATAGGCVVSERSTSDSTGHGDSAVTAPVSVASPEAMAQVLAVQLGAFSDTANAVRLRDSLARAGWRAYIRGSEGKAAPSFRVRVAASRDTTLPRLIASAFAAAHRDAAVVNDEVPGASVAATIAIPVNPATQGMSAAVRWAVAPDRRAMLVVEDPVAIEADPLPNGFVLADEGTGVVVQRGDVWDVEPSPDWRRLAVGLAFTVPARNASAPPPSEWTVLARETGLSADSVKKAAFPSSGMSNGYALAQPAVYDLSVAPVSGQGGAVVLPMAGGWRVGWSASGAAVLVGTNPARASDAEPSPRWMAVDLRGRAVAGGSDTDVPAPVAWTSGPTLDASVPVDFSSRHTIAAGARSIESGDGWIVVSDGKTRQVVGPGTALVATATGRFIAALVPNATGKSPGQPARLVVYDLGK